MWNWISENYPTVLICVALIVVVALIVWSLVKDKKKGKSTCGCKCAHCAMAGSCHSKKK